jgi:two-component system response regulator ResD
MQKIHVLIVDDEWNLRNLLRIFFTKNGFQVTEATNGAEALKYVEQQDFDLVLLDVMMPDMDGWEVCRRVRAIKQTPILMLTARTETKDKIQGLNLGADDYLVKPFEQEELMARVFAILRRTANVGSDRTESLSAPQRTSHIEMGDLVIYPDAREVKVFDQAIELTPREFDLLLFLASNQNRAFTREILLTQVWGEDFFGDIRTVDTHVKNVRDKLRKAGLSHNLIRTVWGVGYKFHGTEVQT